MVGRIVGGQHEPVSSRMTRGHMSSSVWLTISRSPNRVDEKSKLQKAGIGRKRIVFRRKDNSLQVKDKLEEAYPKLAMGGGFELLRSSVSPSDLEVIEPPKSGYSVAFLRDCSGLGQAIAYVRPLQRDLDTTPLSLLPEGCHGGQEIGVRKLSCYKNYIT